MDRTEKVGLGVAIVGHVVVFGALSLGFFTGTTPPPPPPPSIDVSLVDKVGLQATAPKAVIPPAQSKAPELGAPEDAPAAPAAESEPDPAPPKPQPKAAPPPKPAPAPPQPKKPVARTPDKAKEPPKREATTAARPAKAQARATGAGTGPGKRPRGAGLSAEVVAGLTDKPSPSKSPVPPPAKLDSNALASITDAIKRQIQPCASRLKYPPMPGANRIITKLHLRMNRDGSLASAPTNSGQLGVDDQNERYRQQVFQLGVAVFNNCTPLKLPEEYYHTPSGGWDNINFNWQIDQ